MESRYTSMKEEAKTLSDENKSLMTAIRLLNNELQNVLKAEESCSKNANLDHAENIHDHQRQVKTAIQQQKATESQKPKLPKEPGKNTPTRNSAEVTPSPSPTTVIIGDSIIKRVQGQKLGRRVKHRVVVKYFSGASTSDMKHHIKPTLHKAPQQIVLHIGTNDLRDTKPEAVADNIVDIARQIENESDAKVVISELVPRNDRENLKEAVQVVNKRLSKFCN